VTSGPCTKHPTENGTTAPKEKCDNSIKETGGLGEEEFAVVARAAARGKFDEAYSMIGLHYKRMRRLKKEPGRDYKLLHILMLAAEARRGVDEGGAAEDSQGRQHDKKIP
jgi:hypothetical protein